MTGHDQGRIERADLEAVLEARGELGREYEPALVDSFAERIEQAAEARVAQRAESHHRQDDRAEAAGKRQLALGVASLGAGIPLTAIATSLADLPGLAVAWV